jgi:PPK2 family polyphosphate:nucleotide phosphotransferase
MSMNVGFAPKPVVGGIPGLRQLIFNKRPLGPLARRQAVAKHSGSLPLAGEMALSATLPTSVQRKSCASPRLLSKHMCVCVCVYGGFGAALASAATLIVVVVLSAVQFGPIAGRMKMKINSEDFRVCDGDKVNLKEWPTAVKPVYKSKEHSQRLLEDHVAQLSAQQQLLYATNRHAVLLIFQAMDAAGKDGTIKHVMSGVNPQGCQVFSFKHPSATELQHDFLWRTTRDLPERGRIGIFNRSYYEEVLIVRVHPEILRSEGLPSTPHDHDAVWRERYRSIVDLERHLHVNGTRIVKFYLHLSKEEQRKRFLARIDEPEKNWKFSFADIEERKFWKQYIKAYEKCLSATSTRESPWYIVPADDKENTRLIVSRIILDTFEALKMAYPKTSAERLVELQLIREQLAR